MIKITIEIHNTSKMTIAIGYNVNGIRAAGRRETINDLIFNWKPDIICLQECKTSTRYNLTGFDYVYENLLSNGTAGVATYSKVEMKVWPVLLKYKGRIIITYHERLFVLNIYAPNGLPTKYKTYEQITSFKIGFFRYLIRTIQRMKQLRPRSQIAIIGDFNMVAADHKSREGLKKIDPHMFHLDNPIIKRLWGLFVQEKMKFGRVFIPYHRYGNATVFSYNDKQGEVIDYCLTFNAYPQILFAGYKYRFPHSFVGGKSNTKTDWHIRQETSDHIPLVYKF